MALRIFDKINGGDRDLFQVIKFKKIGILWD